MDLDLCLQNTSSWCKSSFISLFTPCILSTFCPYPSSISEVSSPCFSSWRVLVFPKVHSTYFNFLKQVVDRATMWVYLIPSLLDYPFTISVGYPLLFKLLDFVSSFLRLGGWCHVQHNRIMIGIGN